MHPFCATPTGSRFRVRGGSKEILRSAVKLTGLAASGTFLTVPVAPTNVRFQGLKQPCRRNLETAEVDPKQS